MKRASDYVIRVVRLFAPALLTAWVLLPAPAQQGQAYHIGIVSDWTDRHVIFSDPGADQGLIEIDNILFSPQSGFSYPKIRNIPVLRTNAAILTTALDDSA